MSVRDTGLPPPHAASAPLLHGVDRPHGEEGDEEIHQRGRQVEGERLARRLGRLVGVAHQVVEPDDRHQRGVLDRALPEIAQPRQRHAPDLRQLDVAEGLPASEPVGPPGLGLSLVHRQERGAKRLGGIGAEDQRQRGQPGAERAHGDASAGEIAQQLGAAEIDDQQHQELRDAAQEVGHRIGRPRHQGMVRQLGHGQRHAEQQPQRQRAHREQHRHAQAREQERQVVDQVLHPPPAEGPGPDSRFIAAGCSRRCTSR
jgi:hypothetical protein